MQSRIQQAFQLLQQGHRQQAEQICQGVLAQFPNQPDALNLIGLVEQHLGEFAKAEAHFHRVLKFDPAHFQARYNLANLYQTQGKFETAKICGRPGEPIDHSPTGTPA
jgi:tetratricopeptide (TPR) repeat protein